MTRQDFADPNNWDKTSKLIGRGNMKRILQDNGINADEFDKFVENNTNPSLKARVSSNYPQ